MDHKNIQKFVVFFTSQCEERPKKDLSYHSPDFSCVNGEIKTVKENLQGILKKVRYGKCLFISEVFNDFQLINLVPPENFLHCTYFEYNTVSDNQI